MRLHATLATALAIGLVAFVVLHGQSRSGESTVPASVADGRRLLAENGCNGSCHQARTGSADPTSLYTRSTRRVNSREELRHQVEVCVSRLNVMMFAEDIESATEALDFDSYHFD